MDSQQDPQINYSGQKMSPDDPRLSLDRQRTRKIKKGPILLVIIALGLILTATVYSALQPRVKPDNNLKHVSIDSDMVMRSIPDSLSGAAGNYGQLDYPEPPKEVPKLGKPLQGDLGGFTKPQAPVIQQPVTQPKQPSAEELERERQKRLAREAEERALSATLFFKSGNSTTTGASRLANATSANFLSAQNTVGNASANTNLSANQYGNDPNMQALKQQFINNNAGTRDSGYLDARLQAPRSPYEVKAGTIIPAVLITGINSDLPGMITAQVREQVFDSSIGKYLLIPQGSKLIGTYNSNVSYGQNRALVIWSRLIFPNGSSISLGKMSGVDLAGYAGYTDKVDNHWGRLIGGVVLSSLLAGTAQSSNKADDFNSQFTHNVGSEINRVVQRITRKNLDIQPTIKIRPGYSINIMVNKDMILKPYPSQKY